MDTELRGAFLELNGDARDLAPFALPLSTTVSSDRLLRLDDLHGKIVEDDSLEIEIVRAALGKNEVIDGWRAARGKNLLRLDVIATNQGSVELFSTDSLLIVIDGHSYAPDLDSTEVIDEGASMKLFAIYSLPEDVTQFDLLFSMGDGRFPRLKVDTSNGTPLL